MYYLYKHTRLDTGEVFYVGIGVKKNYKTNCNSIWNIKKELINV